MYPVTGTFDAKSPAYSYWSFVPFIEIWLYITLTTGDVVAVAVFPLFVIETFVYVVFLMLIFAFIVLWLIVILEPLTVTNPLTVLFSIILLEQIISFETSSPLW